MQTGRGILVCLVLSSQIAGTGFPPVSLPMRSCWAPGLAGRPVWCQRCVYGGGGGVLSEQNLKGRPFNVRTENLPWLIYHCSCSWISGGLLPRDSRKQRWWRMGQRRPVFGASLGWVEATAHLDGRVGSKESSPKFQIHALKSLAQRRLLGVPNIRQLIPHCLPGEASSAGFPSSWPLKKSFHMASSDAQKRWGLGCRALSQVYCWITDGQWQHGDQRGRRRGGGPWGGQREQGADALYPVTQDPARRTKDGLKEEEPPKKALLCPSEQML